jgi:hypothetical protein
MITASSELVKYMLAERGTHRLNGKAPTPEQGATHEPSGLGRSGPMNHDDVTP